MLIPTLTVYRWEHKIKYLLNLPKKAPFQPVCCVYQGSRVFWWGTFARRRNAVGQQSPEGHSEWLCFGALQEGQNVILQGCGRDHWHVMGKQTHLILLGSKFILILLFGTQIGLKVRWDRELGLIPRTIKMCLYLLEYSAKMFYFGSF